MGGPAVKHGYSNELFIMAMYTAFGNLMNLAAGAMPITLVKEDE